MSPSPETSGSKKAATLTRVRNNQRRCRARKREYVAKLEKQMQDLQDIAARVSAQKPENAVEALEVENSQLRQDFLRLEQKIQVEQATATLAEIQSQHIIQRLEEENKELRDMLARAGLGVELERGSDDRVEEVHENTADTQSLFPLVYSGFTATLSSVEPFGLSTATDSGDIFGIPFFDSPVGLLGMSDSDFTNPINATSPMVVLTEDGPSECCSNRLTSSDCGDLCASFTNSLTSDQCSSSSNSEPESGMTLCSVASELVRQHNNRGVDMIEIGVRLWNGFQKGSKVGEGCKVENRLLFSVLEYISG